MSELDNLLKEDPDFLAYDDWAKDNDSGDLIKNRKNYANYVREEYATAGMYDDRIESEISGATEMAAKQAGLDDEQIKLISMPDEQDLDSKLRMVQKNLDSSDPAWQAATKYLTFKDLNPEGADIPEEIKLKGEQYFADAQAVADTSYNTALRKAVRSGELPLARVKNADGEEEIIASPTLGNMKMAEAIRASKAGGISFADAKVVQSKLSTPIGYNEPLYKTERYDDAASAISELAKKDTHWAKIIQNYSDELAAADEDGRKAKSFEDKASLISYELNKSGLVSDEDSFSNEEVSKALTQIAFFNANEGGKFKLYDDPEEASKNVRFAGYQTPFVHPAAMVNDDVFKMSVTDNPNLSEDQKTILTAQRDPYIQQSFEDINKLLTESELSDDWLNTLQAGRVGGKKDTEIVREFLSDPDNFSEMTDRTLAVGRSIVDGIGEMVAAVPMMMGADWARDYMIDNIKDKSNRRAVARLFGAEYGMGQDIMESIAPMLADVGATALLSVATAPAAGTGGGVYLAAKQGARLTAKGLVKGMTSNALRQLPTETAEQAAERLVAQGLIKASTEEAGRSGAMAAIKGYNSSLAKTIGTTSAVALPAFNRSAGATYASVYSTLEKNKDLTPEEKHDRALGAALTSGTITAAITAGFGAFGRGGLEDALLSGASYKQLKNIATRLAGVDDIPVKKFNQAVAKQLSETLKKHSGLKVGNQVVKNAIDEGAEEALDEFVNGFVSDAATDQDTPFLERLEQAGRAAIIGGVIGGGVPVVKAAKEAVASQSNIGARMAIEVDFARGVSDKLTQSGSPIAAQTVYSILTAPRRTRAPIVQAIFDAAGQPAAEAQIDVEAEEADVSTEEIVEALNKNTSPDAVAKVLVDERGQGMFPFVEDIVPNDVAKRGRTTRKPAGDKSPVVQQMEFDFAAKQEKKAQDQLDLGLDVPDATKPKVTKTRTNSTVRSDDKAGLAQQLGLDFDNAAIDEQNNHVDPNYSDEDLTDEEKAEIEAELAGELAGETADTTPAAPAPKTAATKKTLKSTPAVATAKSPEPAVKVPKSKKPTIRPSQIGAVDQEPMFDINEFIDDELIGKEVSAMMRVTTLGYPVRLERKALHGLPARGQYPAGYLSGKSDLIARKVAELYPTIPVKTGAEDSVITGKDKITFYDPQKKAVVRARPKAVVNADGVGIFNNDPVSMKLLLDRRIPVVVPEDSGTLNPSFRTIKFGNTTYLNDIVMTNPETGNGFVSVLTKQDRVLSSEPNYDYYNSLSSFTSIFNTDIKNRSVPDPKGGTAQVTLDEIIFDADQLYAAASTDRPNSAYGDPEKARATLRSILKPKQGSLEREFFEAAVPAFNMAVRKEAYLYELRVAMDKFSERKSGEETPSLKPDKITSAINELVARTKPEGADTKATVARVLSQTFKSDINPETEPDLFIKEFIESVVLTHPPQMATYREIGSKVGNAFAQQQRERDLFARKALFETTSPSDIRQLQNDTESFDPEIEAADSNMVFSSEPFEAPSPRLISGILKEASFDAASALDEDIELRSQIDKLLRRTVFKGNSAIDVTKLSSSDAFGMIASWMATGNYKTNPEAIKFQRDLRDGVYESGERLRRPLKMMQLASKTIEGDASKDSAYVESIRENLEASFGRRVTAVEASNFIKAIGGSVQPLLSRSYVRGEQILYARQQNDAEVARLGLKTNDPKSVIEALKKIAATETDPNKKLLAKLLLENRSYIQQVEFSLDESPLQYAGAFLTASNGQPMISINLDGHNGRGLVDVLLHEYTHAFVSITAATPNENLNAAQRGSLQRINGILELARTAAADAGIDDPTLTDGLENLNEFVTHFFTSTDFQGYLKSLLPPTKQRGFFRRMIDAVLDMFGLNRSRQQSYQEAFTDIVDLTRSAILSAPMTPNALVNRLAVPASRTLNQASEAAKAIRQVLGTSVEAETVVEEPAINEQEAAAEAQAESVAQSVTEQDIQADVSSEPSSEVLAKVKDVIRMVRRMVPAEFELELNYDIPYAAAFSGGKILLNPARMAGVVGGLDSVSARGIIEGIMTEEVAHAASYNALTQAEIDLYVSTLRDADYDEIADTYYQTDEAREAGKARLRSEDPIEAAQERELLAEEKLRMHSQKVTRGFTTEEDYMFWRTKPSLFKILGRYLKGFINRYMAGKSLKTMRGDQRAVLQRMVTELRAINSGYRLAPNTLEFDTNNPTGTLAQIATQFGATITEEPETTRGQVYLTSALEVLYADSSRLPKPKSKKSNSSVANELATAAQEYWGRTITSQDITPEEEAIIVRNGVEEFIAAFNDSGKNAADWYSTAIEVAMEVASIIHPELSDPAAARRVAAFAQAEDPVQAARLAMRMALAITSQNINVTQNAGYAEEQFAILKRDGKFDSKKEYGAKAAAIRSNLELANILVSKYGYKRAEEFIRKQFTVKDLETQASAIRNKKVSIDGLKEDVVNGAAIFGPKIGQGFLQNLMANFDPVTIDLWMRRTWGRWTGDVVGDGVTDKRLARLIEAARESGIKLPPSVSKLRVIERRDVLASGKLGQPYRSVSDKTLELLEQDEDFRSGINELSRQLVGDWEKMFSLLKKPISSDLYNRILNGEADYKTAVREQKRFDDKLTVILFKQEKSKAEIQRKKAAEKGEELPPFEKNVDAWRKRKYAESGRTILLENEEISSLKPAWAHAASSIKTKLNPIDVPSRKDREVITRVVNSIREELDKRGYPTTNADVQAVLWYPEKDLWAKLRGEEESELKLSYDDEFIKIATQRGLGQQARQAAENIRANRATRNNQRNVQPADRRLSGQADGVTRQIRATQIGSEQYGKITPSIFERSLSIDPDAGRKFSEGIRRTYAEHPMGKAVEVKSEEFYNDPNNRLFLSEDGLTGVAVTSYGDLVSVFKHPASTTKVTGLLEEASRYADTLDAFDIGGFLPNLYSRYGFRPAARVPFNAEYAPEGWPFELAGEPDVVLMVKDVDGVSGLPVIGDGGYDAIRDQVPVTDDYDAAMAMQAAAKEKVAKAQTRRDAASLLSEPKVTPSQIGESAKINWDYNGLQNTPKQKDISYFGFTKPMLPSEFRKIVPKGVSDPRSKDYFKEQIANGVGISPPYIDAKWDDTRKVWVIDPIDHEGRSRTDAAAEIAPNEMMPVSVIPSNYLRARDITDEMRAAPFVLLGKEDQIVIPATPQMRPTQFGSAQLDADYMKAVESGDVEAQQRMVDEAAEQAGYSPEPWYHGTQSKNITVFNRLFNRENYDKKASEPVGIWFTESGEAARILYGNSVTTAYLKLKNPIVFDNKASLDEAVKKAGGYEKFRKANPENDGIVLPTVRVVFEPNQIKSADPITYDDSGKVIPLSKRFDLGKQDIRYTQFGSASQLPARFDPFVMDYSNFIESLESSVLEVGTYQSPSKLIDKIFKGELDPRILRLKNERDFFNKATFDLVKRYKTKLDSIIEKDFGGIEAAPVDLIQDAIGSTKGLALPQDVLDQIEDDFTYDLDVIDTDDSLTAEDKRIARGIALMNRDRAVADAEKSLADSVRARRDQALADLAVQSPDLVVHITQLRTLVDEISKKVTSLYGFPPELKAKFDNQLGIYLTRSYKMFDEVGYAEKVLNDPSYDTIRQAAIGFFEKQFIDSEVQRRISGPNSVPRAQAEREARRELGLKTMGGRTYGQLMMEEFVRNYDKSGSAISATGLSQSLKPLLDNIQMKRDLPKPIRDLLGERGAETGADNLLRSLVTVATMASNQSFLNQIRDIGRQSGWLLNAQELVDARKKDYDTYADYKPVRQSTTSSYDPLGELYGPPEMVDAFRKVFSPDGVSFNQTESQRMVDKTISLASKLSGGAMAAKTLGSLGFYMRNIVSNALFFAPAQGFMSPKALTSMAKQIKREVWDVALADPNRLDAYRTKLISLGIIGDDINTNIMSAMLRGGDTAGDIESKLDELIETAKKGTRPLAWLSERAQVLSASVDSFYKIAYFENELRVLKEARAVDTGSLANMSDSQLEKMARDKVLATAQSASQAPPIVKDVTKSGIGLLFAPFLRFKVEVPRIVLNTYKTSWGEMKSGNSVLVKRGIQRFAGMTTMLGGVSAIIPAAIAKFIAGIGEDEDEALRASLPEYLRNHTFFYRRKADGQLQSWDFTFLNPFAILADPTLRSLEQLFRGNPAKAAAKFIEIAIFDQYLDDQILSSAIQNLRDNENPTTKRPIYEEKLDNAGVVLWKSLSFVFKEAYQPSVMKRAIESYQAMGGDYTEFDDSPAGILLREIYPMKRHDVELDKQLRRYLADTRDVYNRINERKNVLFSKKGMDDADVQDIIQSEIEDKAAINEDVYKKLRGFESLGLSPQQLYQITTGMGYGKERTRLLFNKLMDRPVLNPEYIKRLNDPENPQGAERLRAAIEVLQSTPRYILLEP